MASAQSSKVIPLGTPESVRAGQGPGIIKLDRVSVTSARDNTRSRRSTT